ncbi:hypothetical protein PC129_g2950 [Phytophthora cactorum]|uniref:Uncharacterized protein n=1 Tax=Phytophthora cactorum TaxID=29920 RepID=A0A8T1IP54_9STRA|nr:hypothetical protein PC121_g23097 [Phytophthora cactorum]KAG3226469.1 hypothetical protein PC129_g2950 [Phytophthora cactorum]
MEKQRARTAEVGASSVLPNGSTGGVAEQGVPLCQDSAFPMLERLTESLPHNNEDHAHVSSSLPHLSMATYRGNEESASDTPDESPQPLRRRQRKCKKGGGAIELVAPSRNEIAHWVSEAWRGLAAATIVGGFKRIDLLDDTRPARD